jgi:hypothetical protein
VVRLVPSGFVLDSAGRQVEVRVGPTAEVWKETIVPATDIELGDDVMVNGAAGTPFVAPYVWANIGRIDGVIRNVDATGMLVEVSQRSGGVVVKRVDFSRYVEYGSPDRNSTLTRADLVVGRMISAVVYAQRGGPLLATRIW